MSHDLHLHHAPGRWHLDDIPFHRLAPDRVQADPKRFYLLASASFVEITSDLYTQTLRAYFTGDAEVQDWLEDVWEPEEMQHGVALRRYVERVWPEFDWEETYKRFYAEYAGLCRTDRLGPTHTLELVSRCVIETGTASLYTMIADSTAEPTLQMLARRIRDDEIGHYRYFYHAFRRYLEREPAGYYRIARTLLARAREIDHEDAFLAFKHIYLSGRRQELSTEQAYRSYRRYWMRTAKRHYPYSMAIKMFLKPLGFKPSVQHAVVVLLLAGARYLG